MAEVDSEEIPISNDGTVVGAADFDEDEEDDGDEEEEGCQQGEGLARARCTLKLCFCKVRSGCCVRGY